MQKIKAKTLPGFMELTPAKQIVFDEMKDKIISVFKLNGLSPMDTPILEYSEVLLAKAGGETEKQIYRFKKGDTDMCMRFDLTVPFAKYVAINHNELVFPFRRYQVGKSFRGERAQKGRFREFYQFDMDIISDENLSLNADAECIDIFSQVFEALNQRIIIKINNRKIINGLIEFYNLSEKSDEIMLLLDKKSKISETKFLEELNNLTPKANEILKILNISEPEKLLELNIDNKLFVQGSNEMRELLEILQLRELKNQFVFDQSIIRGLAYYTGTVFEGSLIDLEEKISVGGGGRYDNLAENFTDKNFCGVGASVGLSRLFDLLDKNNLLQFSKTTSSLLAIIPLNIELEHCFKLSKMLIKSGVSNEVLYFDKPFKNKLNYANKKRIPFITVIGEDEINSNLYSLKNMETGEIIKTDCRGLIELLGGKVE